VVYLDKACQVESLSGSDSLNTSFGHQIFLLFREALDFQARILLQVPINVVSKILMRPTVFSGLQLVSKLPQPPSSVPAQAIKSVFLVLQFVGKLSGNHLPQLPEVDRPFRSPLPKA